eukprot:CAMPEP_0170501682 /NCGR_PEP_ID=MMETSP0208-20121228/39099_1 /TAXON_ID=197538 /ORGANISM="Strombidium inclinatum, Strain S3" /LENGTH=47 /DNA_ID= /DNA_START= /DNA_END= /DNA_ORIENTATION=
MVPFLLNLNTPAILKVSLLLENVVGMVANKKVFRRVSTVNNSESAAY